MCCTNRSLLGCLGALALNKTCDDGGLGWAKPLFMLSPIALFLLIGLIGLKRTGKII